MHVLLHIMKKISVFFLLFLVLASVGCKKKYDTGEEFTLKFNETALVKIAGYNIEIKFVKLSEESRCPPNTECVTAGSVAVKIQTEKSSTYSLGLNSTVPSTVIFAGKTIRLLEVNYGKDKNYQKEKKYSIKLKIEE